MVVARGLDSLRKAVYDGRLKRFVTDHGLNQYVRGAYWRIYERVAGGKMRVRVGEASATFHTSTYPEYGAIAAVRGVERPIVRRTVDELDPDDVYWDVGANVGTFACLAGDVLEAGTVVAFEPYPPNVEKLERNLASNDVGSVVEPLALSDSDGEIGFHVIRTAEAGTQQGSIASEYASTDAAVETLTVRTATGDGLVASGDVPPPNVVKVDVEGAAPEVLEGMANTLRGPECRTVVVEPHDNLETVERMLVDAGFRIDDTHRKRESEPPTVVACSTDSGRGPLDGTGVED